MRGKIRRGISLFVLVLLGIVFFVPKDPDLRKALGEAKGALQESLGKEYFPMFTYHTGAPYLFRSFPEFNAFVPALMYELLEPVGDVLQLQAFLDDLRRIPSSSVLSDGLVRYHGRNSFYCQYPPDADDTAVVARLLLPSFSNDTLLGLRSLFQRFHHPRGGYSTWLTDDPSRSFCIIPGQEWNPRDVGVNLHLHRFFQTAGWQEEAERLCEELRRMVIDPKNWIWYRYAPLVPYWRILESQGRGCSLPFPDWMFALIPAEQREYLELVKAIYENPLREHRAVLLKRLAMNHFSFFKEHPPLLYHSDPSAPIHRFYWSPQFAYALWLRLYAELHREKLPGSSPP